MPQSAVKCCFFFKASHAQKLMEEKPAQTIRVEVVKVIQLSAQQFQHFSVNLLRDVAVEHHDLKLRQPCERPEW